MNKILHISNTDISNDSRILKELIALTELCEAEVLAIGVADHSFGWAKLDGSHYLRLSISSRALRILPRAFRYILELIEFTYKATKYGLKIKPRIIHCHDTFALPSGWLLKKTVGCKLVYDAHELESDKNGQNFILSKATLLIEKFCWQQIDLLVSVSDSIIDWYSNYFGEKPSALILNSPMLEQIPAPSFNRDRNDRINYFHKKYQISPDNRIFVYLGILGPGRGIEIYLDAFASGPEKAHVVFIGFGPLAQSIANHSKSYSNIHLHPPVPHDQVVPLVRNADYGLCLIEKASLSDYYCLPNKLFEYCFAGLPVLASDFPEIKKLVETYSLGICCKPTQDSLKSLLCDTIGERPKSVTSDISILSWEVQAQRLISVYKTELMNYSHT